MLPWGQRTDWPSLQRIGQRADELGYDSLWTWDHLYPDPGRLARADLRGLPDPCGLGRRDLACDARADGRGEHVPQPGPHGEDGTTLDHMSDGRAILGIGGAWFEREHAAFGLEFGSGFGERLDWLDEAVELMRAMLRGEAATATGPALPRKRRAQRPAAAPGPAPDPHRRRRRAEDPPHRRQVRRRLEHGRRPRLRAPQGRGPAAVVREVGRDESEIERTLGLGLVMIRDDLEAAQPRRRRVPQPPPGLRRCTGTGTAERDRRVARALRPARLPAHLLRRPGTVR